MLLKCCVALGGVASVLCCVVCGALGCVALGGVAFGCVALCCVALGCVASVLCCVVSGALGSVALGGVAYGCVVFLLCCVVLRGCPLLLCDAFRNHC